MAVIEVLAMLGLLGVGGTGLFSLIRSLDGRRQRQHEMQQDLRDALKSADHRKLDDFLVLWRPVISNKTAEYVRERRDQLFIEANDSPKARP